MSDLSMFDMALERATLHVVGWKWNGTTKSGIDGVAALQRELPLRGARLTEMHNHRQAAISGDRGSENYIDITILRNVDGMQWEGRIFPGHWLLLWLHDTRLHHAEIALEEYGDLLLRPSAPIVTLSPPDERDRPEREGSSVIRFPHGEHR